MEKTPYAPIENTELFSGPETVKPEAATYGEQFDQLGAAFKENFIGTAIYESVTMENDTNYQLMNYRSTYGVGKDDGYDWYKDPRRLVYPAEYDSVLSKAVSQQEATFLLGMQEKLRQRREKAHANGLMSGLGAVAGAIVDPLLLVPANTMKKAVGLGLAVSTVEYSKGKNPGLDPDEVKVNMAAGVGAIVGLQGAINGIKRGYATMKNADPLKINELGDKLKEAKTQEFEMKAAAEGGQQSQSPGKSTISQTINRKTEAIKAVNKAIDDGVILPEHGDALKAFIDAAPESLLHGSKVGFADHPTASGGYGKYFEAKDFMQVFTRAANLPNGSTPDQIFKHELGHRVMLKLLGDDDRAAMFRIFERVRGETKHSDFLSRYAADDDTQFGEWFAESFRDYWNRRQADELTNPKSLYSKMQAKMLDVEASETQRVMARVAVSLIEMVQKLARDPRFSRLLGRNNATPEQLEDVLVDNFFEAITRRGEEVDALRQSARRRNAAQRQGDDMAAQGVGAKEIKERLTAMGLLRPGDDSAEINEIFNKEGLLSAKWLEKLPDSPAKRALNSENALTRELVGHLVEHPFFQSKHVQGIASGENVERAFRRNYLKPLVDTMKKTEDLYQAYRDRVAGDGQGGSVQQVVMDGIKGLPQGVMSANEFFEEVGKAKRLMYVKGFDRSVFPQEVLTAAQHWDTAIYRKMGEEAKTAIGGNSIFAMRKMREKETLTRNIEKAVRTKEPDAVVQSMRDKLAILEKEIKDINNAPLEPNYLNRVYKTDVIRERRDEFVQILMQKGNYTYDGAQKATDLILSARNDLMVHRDAVGMAKALHERTLDVEDIDILDFLENDIFALGQQYVNKMGMDLELARKFGSVDMYEQISEIRRVWKERIGMAPKELRADMRKQMDADIEDLEAMRDRLRGTYGVPDDPDTYTHRGLKVAKAYNAITMLTGAQAAFADIARPIMYEGLHRTFGSAFQMFSGGFRSTIYKMAKEEAQLAGEAFDTFLSMRSAMFADMGQDFGTGSRFERALKRGQQGFFNINLMNQWNEAAKTMASLISGSRIIDMSEALAKGSIPELEMMKLARAGIDKDMAKRIADMFKINGFTNGKVKIARTENWIDKEAAKVYRDALGRDMNIVIVTPSVGDVPLFMSNAAMGLIFQFKTFGMAATQRVLIPGLQRTDRNFLIGSAFAVALGMAVDQLRRAQRGETEDRRPLLEQIFAGFEKSGIGGSLVDAHGAVAMASGNTMSINNLLGGADYGPSPYGVASAVGGPIVQQFKNAGNVISDIATGSVDGGTTGDIIDLTPMNNTGWADGLFDAAEQGLNYLMGIE